MPLLSRPPPQRAAADAQHRNASNLETRQAAPRWSRHSLPLQPQCAARSQSLLRLSDRSEIAGARLLWTGSGTIRKYGGLYRIWRFLRCGAHVAQPQLLNAYAASGCRGRGLPEGALSDRTVATRFAFAGAHGLGTLRTDISHTAAVGPSVASSLSRRTTTEGSQARFPPTREASMPARFRDEQRFARNQKP